MCARLQNLQLSLGDLNCEMTLIVRWLHYRDNHKVRFDCAIMSECHDVPHINVLR